MSDEEDFAAMFEASAKAAPLRTGQALEGTVVASIALDELRDDDGALEVAVGVCEYRARQEATPGADIGSLAEKLRGALGRKP